MQTLHPSALSGVVPVRYPIIQSQAANQWIDVNNESAVILGVSLSGRPYLIPPNTTVRYHMDGTETFVEFTPQSAADPTKDSVSGTVYNEQDSVPVEIERGANAADILPITSGMIADGAVIAGKVAADAINTVNIVNGAVATAKVATGAITNALVATNAIASGNIQSGAVGNTQLATGAVASGNIQSGAVGNTQLAALSVALANIQDGAVATAKIADGAVSTTKIANLAVTNALIANGAIGTAQIQSAAITTALIQTAAITDALIASVSASKISAGTISASISITSPTITGGVVRTAASGQRIEITSASVNSVNAYSGNAAETAPGGLNIDALGDVFLNSATATGGALTYLRLYAPSPLGPSNLAGRVVMSPPIWHSVGAAGEPAFNGNWTNYSPGAGPGEQPLQFCIDAQGFVHLRGTVRNTINGQQALFTLPAGYLPTSNQIFAVHCSGGFMRYDVSTAGVVHWVQDLGTGLSTNYVSVDNVLFHAS